MNTQDDLKNLNEIIATSVKQIHTTETNNKSLRKSLVVNRNAMINGVAKSNINKEIDIIKSKTIEYTINAKSVKLNNNKHEINKTKAIEAGTEKNKNIKINENIVV